MLKNLVNKERDTKVSFALKCKAEFDVMKADILALKDLLNKQSDGLLDMSLENITFNQTDFNMSRYPKIVIERPMLINIRGSIDCMSVSSFNVFPLMGAKYTQEEFFKVIAKYF